MARDGEVKQRQHFCHYGDTICHPKSGHQPNCTKRLHVDATIMRSFQAELFSSFLPSTYDGNVIMPNWKHGSTVEFIIFRV